MKFFILIFMYFCAFMVCFGFYNLFVWFGWLEEEKPEIKPIKPEKKEDENIALPQKVNSMEWEVCGNYTNLKSVKDANSKSIKLEL